MRPNRAAARGINYRLCENGFIDNDGDREKFNGNLDELARIYLECFGITAGSAPAAVPQPQPAQQETTENFGGTYRCTVDHLRVRDAPGLGGTEVAHYSSGETVTLDNWYNGRRCEYLQETIQMAYMRMSAAAVQMAYRNPKAPMPIFALKQKRYGGYQDKVEANAEVKVSVQMGKNMEASDFA